MKNQSIFRSSNLGFFLLTTAIPAAEISWSVSDISGNVTDVSTTGTLVEARAGSDLGIADTIDGTTVEINGVTFSDDFTIDTPNRFDSIGGRQGSYTAENSAYSTLLVNADRDTDGTNSITFTGLTPGNQYQLQIWAADNANVAQDRALVVNDGSSTPADINAAGHAALLFEAGGEGSYGQFALGTFFADSASQSVQVQHYNGLAGDSGGPTGQVFVNAVQLRDLGEVAPDSDPPTPDPMRWALTGEPVVVSESVITMTAATAIDDSGVQYQFTRYAADGATVLLTGPWQDSPEYTDTGLVPDTSYGYAVKARDRSATNNETAPSPVVIATTLPADTDPPGPDPATFINPPTALSSTSITMTATTATDDSGVEYQFTRYAADGVTVLFTSPWQDSPQFTDVGLTPDTEYRYTARGRDKSIAQNATVESDLTSVATSPVTNIAWTVFNITGEVSEVSTEGMLVGAWAGSDLGIPDTVDGTSLDINGVTFTDDFTVDSPTHRDTIGGRAGSYSAGNEAYFTLLVNADRDSGGSDSITFDGLSVGNEYQIQIWAADTANDAQDRALVLNDGSGTPANIETAGHATLLFEAEGEGSYGQYALGTFTAGSPSQSFLVQHYNGLTGESPGPTGQVMVNAVQLRDLGFTGKDLDITSITGVGGGIWQLTVVGRPDTAYEFRSSNVLGFAPGALIENLTNGIPSTGDVGGPGDSQLVTDSNGNGTVRMTLAGSSNFVRAQLSTADQ